jgi:sterol desaturase/sphingolipid hydroxylase (fatty acid hydroxylase superfamily)
VTFAILHYEWVHYVAHVPYRPRTPIGRWIKQYHLRHHFISEKFWFGVSNPALDLLGGTFRQARDVARSATTRKLFGSPPIVIASARRRASSGSKAFRS